MVSRIHCCNQREVCYILRLLELEMLFKNHLIEGYRNHMWLISVALHTIRNLTNPKKFPGIQAQGSRILWSCAGYPGCSPMTLDAWDPLFHAPLGCSLLFLISFGKINPVDRILLVKSGLFPMTCCVSPSTTWLGCGLLKHQKMDRFPAIPQQPPVYHPRWVSHECARQCKHARCKATWALVA